MIRYSPYPEVRKLQQDPMYQFLLKIVTKKRIIEAYKKYAYIKPTMAKICLIHTLKNLGILIR